MSRVCSLRWDQSAGTDSFVGSAKMAMNEDHEDEDDVQDEVDADDDASFLW